MVTPSHSPSGCCAFNRAAAHILNGLWGFFSCSVGPGSFREETDTLVRCLANAGWFCRRILRRCFLRSASSKVGASSTESSDFVSKSTYSKGECYHLHLENQHTTIFTIPSLLNLRALLFRRLNLWRRFLLSLLICFYTLIIPAPPHRPWKIIRKSEIRPFIFFFHPRIQSQITRVEISLVLVEPRRWCRGSRQRVVKIIILARALAARPNIVQVSEVLLWDVIKGVPFFCSRRVLSRSVATAVAEV